MNLEFRILTFEEFKELTLWAYHEGWDPGINDAHIFYKSYPEGFYGFFEKEKLIAGGSLVSYNGDFGFMGFFIVNKEYRGNGIGRFLWFKRRDLLLSQLKSGTAIGMDGVLTMQKFYAQGGFEIAFRDERRVRLGKSFSLHSSVQKINERTDLNEILSFDKTCFGFDRKEFMTNWIMNPTAVAFCSFDEHGKTVGLTVLRKTNEGYKIGPLFANNYAIAEYLYQACLNEVPAEKVYLDIPCCNEDAVRLSSNYETEYVFECARMYYGNPPEIPLQKVFGITTFELG